MRKIVSMLITLCLVLSIFAPAFAADNSSIKEQVPTIKSTVTGHEIDYSALNNVLQSINDKEKKDKLIQLFVTPVTTEERHYDTNDELQKVVDSKRVVSDETIQVAKKLSAMSIDEMDNEISNIVKAKAAKILNDKDVKTTKEFVQLATQYDPANVSQLKGKVEKCDDKIIVNKDEVNLQAITPEETIMSIISKYYSVYRNFKDIYGNEMTWFSVGVDWQYNNSNWDIVYLAPDTNYGVADWDYVHFFLGLDQSAENIKLVGVSDQAYVQKGAYVYASIPGGDWPLHAYIVDLVFRANSTTTNKLIYSVAKSCDPTTYHNYAGSWGGGV